MSFQFAEYPIAITSEMVDSLVQIDQKELQRLITTHAGKASFAPAMFDVGDARIVIEQAAIKVDAQARVKADSEADDHASSIESTRHRAYTKGGVVCQDTSASYGTCMPSTTRQSR